MHSVLVTTRIDNYPILSCLAVAAFAVAVAVAVAVPPAVDAVVAVPAPVVVFFFTAVIPSFLPGSRGFTRGEPLVAEKPPRSATAV